MKKSKRRVLFYTLVLVFVVTTPLVLLYALGYVFDAETRSFVSAGGVFVKTNQAGITIFLDGVLQRETSVFIAGALVPTVSLGAHHLRIEKEGYRPWEKEIVIQKQRVVEYRTITLIPNDPPLVEQHAFDLKNPFSLHPSPKRDMLALYSEKEKKLIFQSVPDEKNIFEKKLEFSPKKITWLDDAHIGLSKNPGGTEWLVLGVSGDREAQEEQSVFSGTIKREEIIELKPHPLGEGTYFLTKSHSLWLFPKNSSMPKQLHPQVVYFEMSADKIFFVNEKGFFASSDLLGENVIIAGRPGFFMNNGFASFSSTDYGVIALIDGVGGFFLYDSLSHGLSSFTTGVKKVSFNEKNDKALLQKDTGLSTVFLEAETTMPFRKQFSINEMDVKKQIIDSTWYGKNYVFFTTPEGFFGLEAGIRADDFILQKISDETGALFADTTSVTVINEKGVFRYAIE